MIPGPRTPYRRMSWRRTRDASDHVPQFREKARSTPGTDSMRESVLHDVPVYRQSGHRSDHRNLHQLGGPLSPGRYRIRNQVVGPFRAPAVQFVAQQLGGGTHEQAGQFLHTLGQALQILQKGVAIRAILPACLLDFVGKRRRGIVRDPIAARRQFADQRQRRIDVAVQRETEENGLHGTVESTLYRTPWIWAKVHTCELC